MFTKNKGGIILKNAIIIKNTPKNLDVYFEKVYICNVKEM